MQRLLKHIFLYTFFIAGSFSAGLHAQPAIKDTSGADSSLLLKKVVNAGNKDQARNRSSYDQGRISIRQNQIINTLLHTAQTVKIYLDTELDLANFEKQLDATRQHFELVQDGILTHTGTAQTDRNLTVSDVILDHLIYATKDNKAKLDRYTETLIAYRSAFDSLLSDPAVYTFPTDSAKIITYLARLKVMAAQGNPVDNALNASLEQAQHLQNKTDSILFVLNLADEKIEQYRNQLSQINLKREFNNIWESIGFKRDFSEIARFSISKEQAALGFYTQENSFKMFFLALFTVLAWLGIRALRKYITIHEKSKEFTHLLIMKHPLAASVIIIFSIFQFAFTGAPFIFSCCIWTVQIIALLSLLYGYITPFWYRFLIGTVFLFLLSCGDNLILQASRPERWFLFCLALAGVGFSVYFLLARSHKADLKERYILIYLQFLWVFELSAALLNMFGRYNLSKTLLTAGYTGLFTAIVFTWTIHLVNECLKTASELYHHSEQKLLYLNFNRIGSKVPRLLYFLLAIGWCVIVGRNFYFYNKLSVHFLDFLHKQRTIGDYTFALDGLFLFFIIALCSLLLSRLISLFSANPNAEHASLQTGNARAAKGSWILLIRIAIITIGMLVAFAASGLPVDKITIVLGALSVGVGLGLQSLVSNLVSGLIIAFERPVNVGDLIEINGKSGVMKSIGFRSSVVLLNDGSSLIVPNGDLLSTHLVNWSISHNRRKIVITINVDYEADLDTVSALLAGIAEKEEHVLQYPQVIAIARQFATQAVLFDLIFWINSQSDSIDISSRIIKQIHTVFKEKGINIPHAQNITMPFPGTGNNG